ncbi:stage II sporulation protein M [Staphylococcus epidermidis]|uniref:stage II sporulation protein M n=1 Tax=Staphylococcus TaxID=1279 RepID=UPI00211EE9E7|nr:MULTISPECIES: stage II sporulation protein M [Staphylococcus]MDU3189249.1 stage II sporulation protein M [Streptococcus mitis]MDH8928344.1 stage II sporulation protein M [Staphylococcus epidermidis]MDH8937472.1 stage II sporulation protein M [Staphylococcus epidermidis]MDH8939858.1 stage II sporulation protein M [Staphylococcus epidermidis]MDH8951414.1 stage II sporulation protein M [Staphylococcus epidermidis]
MFLIGILMGILIGVFSLNAPDKLKLNTDLNVTALFCHNYMWFIIYIFGFLSLGILNISMLIYNGGIIGFLIGYSIKTHQLIQLMLWLLPHGIFEITSLIITNGYSFFILVYLYKSIIKEFNVINKKLKLFLISILLTTIFTIVASFLEVYINLII